MIERGRPAFVRPLDELWTATIFPVRVENERAFEFAREERGRLELAA